MIPVHVTESVTVVKVPSIAQRTVESCLRFSDMRRHKEMVRFEPRLAAVRHADTLIVYGHNSTRKRYVSRTFYEPRVRASSWAETDFVRPKTTQRRFQSFLDYHIDDCRKWFKTCVELKARTFSTIYAGHGDASIAGTTTTTTSTMAPSGGYGGVHDGPGASQVYIPVRPEGNVGFDEREFVVSLTAKDKVDINMNEPLHNGF